MGGELDQFRTLVQTHLPAEWVAAVEAGDHERVEALATGDAAADALELVAANGWLTPDWPTEYGGRGLTSAEALAVRRELYRWRIGSVRSAIGTAWVGPTILKYGTGELKAQLLPAISANRALWCQLFSEPEAGSDLAAVRTTAVRGDDMWTVSGTKIWTSRADTASFGLAVARTDSTVPKHAGLTCFCIDLSQPGVSISPIRQMTGDSEFFEIRLDRVAVSDTMRLGEPGQGWEVVRTVLGFERSAGSGIGAAPPGSVVGRGIDELVEHCQGKLDPIQADHLVQTWLESQIIEMNNRRLAVERAGSAPSWASGTAFNKVLQAEHTKRLQQLFVDLDGAPAIGYPADDPDAGWLGQNVWAMLRVQAKTIAGGTSEVLRNQLAERALSLPREVDPSRHQPWNEFVRGLNVEEREER